MKYVDDITTQYQYETSIKNAGFSQTLHSFFLYLFFLKNKEKEVYD